MAAASVNIYARPEGLYVATSDQTTAGLWLDSGHVELVGHEPPDAVGRVVGRVLACSRVGIRHPRQDEWMAQRGEALKPLLALAQQKSWAAFIREAAVVGVLREVDIEVTPHRRSDRPRNSFVPILESSVRLTNPTDTELGDAVLRAVGVATGLELY